MFHIPVKAFRLALAIRSVTPELPDNLCYSVQGCCQVHRGLPKSLRMDKQRAQDTLMSFIIRFVYKCSDLSETYTVPRPHFVSPFSIMAVNDSCPSSSPVIQSMSKSS